MQVGEKQGDAMQVLAVRDLEDPRLAGYRSLKDVTLASRHGRFVVEGRGNVEVLLADSDLRPESILLSDRVFASMRADLARLAPACPVFVAPQPALDEIVGFSIHRGCLALCVRPPERDPLELARMALTQERSPRLLALDGVGNHDNVGGIFRNARAFGAHGVILCPRSCDPLYRKAVRTSMGGSLCVAFARATVWPECLGSLRELGYVIVALDPGAGSDAIERLEADETGAPELGATVLVLGSEGPGLSDELRRIADRRVRIAMEPGVDSLNVAVAAGIALHRLRGSRSCRAAPAASGGAADHRVRR